MDHSDSAFVNVGAEEASGPTPGKSPTELIPVDSDGFQVTATMMLAGIAAAGVGLLVLLLGVLGVFGRGNSETVEDRISAYTRKGSRKLSEARRPQTQQQGVTAQAVGMAEKALSGSSGLSDRLGNKLEAAGMAIKPAEWLLAHAGIAFLSGLVALLLSSGSIPVTVLRIDVRHGAAVALPVVQAGPTPQGF